MKAFTFQAPPNILFEAGASSKLAETVAGYGVERVLLVTDKGVRNAGLTKGAEASLTKNGYSPSTLGCDQPGCDRYGLGAAATQRFRIDRPRSGGTHHNSVRSC